MRDVPVVSPSERQRVHAIEPSAASVRASYSTECAMAEEAEYEIELRDPEPVLRRQLGDGLKVLDYESKSLVKAGENYGSTILGVRLRVRRAEDREPEELHLVAKMMPPTSFQREMFESPITFRKEIFVYEDLVPVYDEIYGERLAVTPGFFGARLALDPAKEVDDDAVLFLENMKKKNYYMADRHEGLDEAHMKAALTALAKFHVTGMSVKEKKPSYLPKLKASVAPIQMSFEKVRIFVNETIDELQADAASRPYLERVRASKALDRLPEEYYLNLEPEEPWACVVHGDFWGNNALFHKDEASGRVDDALIVDFQTCYLSSPLTDLAFLLCTSLRMPMANFDEMLEFYRLTAREELRKLGCDDRLFEKEEFDKRLAVDAKDQLFHVLVLTKVVELRDGEDLMKDPMNQFCVARLRRIIQIFVDKNWI